MKIKFDSVDTIIQKFKKGLARLFFLVVFSLIAFLIVAPLSYFFMNLFLENVIGFLVAFYGFIYFKLKSTLDTEK